MSLVNMSRIKSSIDSSPHIIRRRSKTTLREAPQFLKQKQKPTLQHLQTQIFQNHQTINNIIDQFETILYQKLQKHEDQILKVYRNSMQKLIRQVEIMMKQYNKLIQFNKTSNQMNRLQNELQYFTKESVVLFEQNKKYQSDIKKLKKTVQQLRSQNKTKDLTILHLTKKLFRKAKKINLINEENSQSVVSATNRKPSQSIDSSTNRKPSESIITSGNRKPTEFNSNIYFRNQKYENFKFNKVSKTFYKTQTSYNDDHKLK